MHPATDRPLPTELEARGRSMSPRGSRLGRPDSRGGRRGPRRAAAIAGLALALLAACGSAGPTISIPPDATGSIAPAVTGTPPAAPEFPVTLLDDEGNEVEIAAQPERIVSLTPANTEILFAIGAGSRVIATTDFDDYPPEAIDLPEVASYTSVDVEKIVGLEAELVLAGGNSFNDPDALQRLRDLRIPVVVVYAETLQEVLADIELIGRATGFASAAGGLASDLAAGFAAVETATSTLDRPRVFYELDASAAIYTAADDSWIAEMIETAGGQAITTGSPTNFEISIETLIAADPEVIVLGDAAYGVTAEQVAARPGWSIMTAVTRGAIRPVNDLIVTRPGPRLTDGLRELALAIHPDLVLDGRGS